MTSISMFGAYPELEAGYAAPKHGRPKTAGPT